MSLQLNNDHLTRQMDLIPMKSLGRPITVIGAGAIGSFSVLALVKMGFYNVTVYDFDRVSVENMNCQWFRFSDIGKLKVEALRSLIEDFTRTQIKIKAEKFDGTQKLEGIVIASVDSMAVRQTIWDHVRENLTVPWLIDPRMAAEYALSFTMNPHDDADVKSYETTLYSDRGAVQEPCTAKATMYTATMIAGHVAKQVKDIVTNGDYARVTHWDIALNNYQSWPKAKVLAEPPLN